MLFCIDTGLSCFLEPGGVQDECRHSSDLKFLTIPHADETIVNPSINKKVEVKAVMPPLMDA